MAPINFKPTIPSLPHQLDIQPAHTTVQCNHHNNSSVPLILTDLGMNFEPQFSNLEFNKQTKSPSDRETLLDTGATNHLTGDSKRYDDFLWSQFNSNRS
ncbi:hypothetical protein PGT21_012205 [Puccinia graminis f. sp. tritici]|uniref:Uncharacterized protein n=1 Tax=Puccinia graminis f. sp. tritici TaxID=56615 RepID=A0A5B0N606_PUCGR|nr:hypothetical protein PGTUg99_016642 [Puccinia graminis f. sp. tritici]KAA1083944.1 hypothetical protein PGT21_012205 [Puccinia graminis f. sp. tritici]